MSFLSRKSSKKNLEKKKSKSKINKENENVENEDDFKPIDINADREKFKKLHEEVMKDERLAAPVDFTGAKV
jgi:hypothetical protein